MFKLILITVVGVVALILLFEVTREQEIDYAQMQYYELVSRLVAAQPPGEGLSWQVGPWPVPGMEHAQEDYIVLAPVRIDWGGESGAEGRQLPPPPPIPPATPKPHSRTLKPGVVAEGFLQTKWASLREKNLGKHTLVKGYVDGKYINDYIAKLAPVDGPEPVLRYYECYRVPFRVYSYQREVPTRNSSRYPLGRRLMNVDMPWVEWGEPGKVSVTTCWTAFEAKSAAPPKTVPRGVYEVQVIEHAEK